MGGRTASSGGCGGACDATLVENASTEPDSTSTALSTAGPSYRILWPVESAPNDYAASRQRPAGCKSVCFCAGGGGHARLKS